MTRARLRRQLALLILALAASLIGREAAPRITVVLRATRADPHHVYHDPKGYRALDAWPRRLRSKAARVARCESHLNYRAVSRSRTYRGAYQFSQTAWNSAGGTQTGDGVRPERASRFMQDRHAYRLYQARRWSPWPYCGRR